MADDEPLDPRLAFAQAVYRVFVEHPDGRTVREWMRVNFLMQRSFVPGDPHVTSFREGRRDVPLEIEDQIALAEDPRRLTEVEERLDG